MLNICVVSRLIPSKRIDILILSLLHLLTSGSIRLHIYGAGPQYHYLNSLLAEHCIADCVLLHGFKHNILKAIQDHNLFIFPSSHEGFGKAPFEALFCGLPVLCSSEVNILNEFSTNAQTFLFNSFDFSWHSNTPLQLDLIALLYPFLHLDINLEIQRVRLLCNEMSLPSAAAHFSLLFDEAL
jgi:hypothetical protein